MWILRNNTPDAFCFSDGWFWVVLWRCTNAAQILEFNESECRKSGYPWRVSYIILPSSISIEQGYKVAIAEQMAIPNKGQARWSRSIHDSSKPDSQNNFLVSLDHDGNQFIWLIWIWWRVTFMWQSRFTLVCGKSNPARECWVITEEEQILQPSDLLGASYEKKALVYLHWIHIRVQRKLPVLLTVPRIGNHLKT